MRVYMFYKLSFFWFPRVLLLSMILFQQSLFAKEALTSKASESIKDAVVKIIVVSRVIDKKTPWNSNILRSSGSGFIIDENRILTNAHVVSNATFIEVKKQSGSHRYQAEVEEISHDADLAILKLTKINNKFFDTPILEFSELPKLQKEVETYGYPMGGSGLSITKGVVSRIERKSYVHKGKYFISVQIDAAINPGNSGGPVISDGKVVGIVMQSQVSSQSIGYMIPVPVIKHFLTDIKDGKYDGYPSLGIDAENTQSPAIRELYGLDADHSGVLVSFVYPNSPAKGKLKKNDVITAIDGHNITNEGKSSFRKKEMISFRHYIDMHQLGDTLKLDILRDGKASIVEVTLSKTGGEFKLLGDKQFEKPPSYFIYGGFVFMPLTSDYINASNSLFGSGLDENLTVLSQFWPTEERKQAVIISKVLPDNSNKGFHNISDFLIKTINGRKFKDFKQFYKILNESDSKFIVLEDEFGYQVVIHRGEGKKHHASILKRYRISEAQSVDLAKDASVN